MRHIRMPLELIGATAESKYWGILEVWQDITETQKMKGD